MCVLGGRTSIPTWLCTRTAFPTRSVAIRLTWPNLAKLAHTFVGEPVSIRALRRHLTGHCRLVGEAEKAEVEELADEQTALVASFLERVKDGEQADPDDALDFVIALGVSELESRLRREGKSGVSVDQMLKAVEAKTRRKTNDAQQAPLGSLTLGIEMSVRGQLAGGPALTDEEIRRTDRMLEAPEVIEGEVVAEEDEEA